jgi:hypothetical protein
LSYPLVHTALMENSLVCQGISTQFPSMQFAHVVWRVGAIARQYGLVVPGFRDSRTVSVRVVRRRAGHGPVVVIPTVGRSADQVVVDVVDGVLAVNSLVSVPARQAFLADVYETPTMQAA